MVGTLRFAHPTKHERLRTHFTRYGIHTHGIRA